MTVRGRAARSLLALLAVATVGNAAAACSTSVPAPLKSQSQSLAADQTLRVHLPEAPRSLDPALAQDEREQAVIGLFSEPLLRPGAGLGDVVPAAAESYSVSDDGLTWTFRIRGDARWSDGQPVHAQDFVYAWKRIIDPRTAAPHADWFAAVVRGGVEAAALGVQDPRIDAALGALGLQAPDDQTFQVTAPRVVPQLKWIATLPEGGPARGEPAAPPGTVADGPFHVTDSGKDRVTLAPNPSYWAGRTTLSKVVLSFGGDASSALSSYRSGGLEVLAGVSAEAAAGSRDELIREPELTVFWIDFNVERQPFTDPRVRQAFAEAVDRQAVVSDGFDGQAVPATTLIPNGMSGYHPEYGKPQEFDADTARQLLDQAQVPRDQLAGLPLIVRDRAFDKQVAALVASQLQRNLGVTVTVQPLSTADYAARLRAGDFALAGPTGWTADYPDPQDFFDIFQSTNGNNRARYRSARYDAVVRLADGQLAGDRRSELYGQAAQLLEQDTPVMFLAQRQRWALVKPYVKGVQALPVDAWPGATNASQLWIATH